MKENWIWRFILALIWLAGCGGGSGGNPPPAAEEMKLQPPPDGQIYHAAYPDFGGWEDEVTAEKVTDFEELVGKELAWAYVSNNWWRPDPGIRFPKEHAQMIYSAGSVPYIRMMPRNEDPETGDMALPDPHYTMQAFIDGDFDDELRQWARDARRFERPLIVEFGTEVNGWWFPWNASWNGEDSKTDYGDPELYDGMERFRDAYRHIIDLFREEGVTNITWVYHIDAYDDPAVDWNNKHGYYPGDDYIDWIAFSAYGSQTPGEGWWLFSDMMTDSWDDITAISDEGKPIALLEWGVIDYPEEGDKAAWITDAFATFGPGSDYYPQIKAISYWHENFDTTNLRLDSSPEALEAYKAGVADDTFISDPIFGK